MAMITEEQDVEKQVSVNDDSMAIVPTIVKCLIIALPSSLLPDRFPLHPHVAFGFGLIGGLIVQHFIPPRGRHLLLLIAVAIVLIAVHTMLK